MAWIGVNDLQFKYSWTAIPPDDARVTGKPDSTFLNRGEGYEVLAFLNRVSSDKAGALKGERMIKSHLPGDIRSHKNVLQWLIDNWGKYI
ncbi:hypothetical protein [Variovorax sp. 770b2]|uniref:hypothetical protein n=1 Tax=Variovorax sp. 770b2 TaxID=1566271 RepID=UPI0008DFE66F|nr:hypothetical protein [Variovorax sp. 770b2]SFP15374.1 hypothetical protein SAMN03159339_0602 [Variovorax sp. 770b2]